MQIGVEAQRAVENRRVFVVDGDDINRTVLQFMLADDNETHELGSVASVDEKGRQWRPDLIIVSALLIAENGNGLVARWQSAWPEVKVLVICEACDDACVTAAKAAGADNTLSRPFKLEAVRRKVDRWLGRKVEIKIPVVLG